METATVVLSPATWLPEDDILLKKAIEYATEFWSSRPSRIVTLDGASLEALAKGAVPFSRTFTLQEVHDRWHALLYNPDVSAQACAHLHLDESDKIKEINASHRKRKVGSLRKRYYAMLKRIRHDFFSSADLGFLNESDLHHSTANGGDAFHSDDLENLVCNQITETAKNDCLHEFPVANPPFSAQGSIRIDGLPPFHLNNNECNDIIPHSLQANSTGAGKCLLLGDELSNTNVYSMGFSPPLPSMPLWKTMEDVASENVAELPDNGDYKSKSMDKQNGDSFINSVSILDGDFVDLPDSLFDFSNDDTLFMDVNRSYPVDKSCCDNMLSNVPLDMGGINTLNVGEEAMIDVNIVAATVLVEEKPVSHTSVQMSSTSTLKSEPLEQSEGVLYCALNTEDPEIPCNDDIFLLIHPDAPCTSAMTSITKSSLNPVSIKEKNIELGLNSVKKSKELAESSKPSQKFASYMLPDVGQVHTGEALAVVAESDVTCKDLGPRHTAVPDPTQFEPATVANLDIDVKNGVEPPAILRELPLNAEIGLVEISSPEPVFNPSTPDQEMLESENDEPNFSDIEAMILDMDLGEYDDDLHFTRRVSKYQQENSKRTIMRLEQCARVSIQRAMTSHGALAVFYGRRSRHFICKREVLLGRSTEETVVDIDLGKEGRNNKISRRQAILKMEDDGSFTLKNLAKNPILVNGTEVGTGESIDLNSSCLIEIRGISFVFESNQKYVSRYLENARMKQQGQLANFEWLPKDEAAIS